MGRAGFDAGSAAAAVVDEGTSRDGPGSCRGWSAESPSPQRPQTGGHPLLHPCNAPKPMGTQFVIPTEPPNCGAPSSPSPQSPQNWSSIPVVPQNQGRVARGRHRSDPAPGTATITGAGRVPGAPSPMPSVPHSHKTPQSSPHSAAQQHPASPSTRGHIQQGTSCPQELGKTQGTPLAGVGINPLPNGCLGTEPRPAPALGRCPGADGRSPPGLSAPQHPGAVSEPGATQIPAVPHASSAGSCRVGAGCCTPRLLGRGCSCAAAL